MQDSGQRRLRWRSEALHLYLSQSFPEQVPLWPSLQLTSPCTQQREKGVWKAETTKTDSRNRPLKDVTITKCGDRSAKALCHHQGVGPQGPLPFEPLSVWPHCPHQGEDSPPRGSMLHRPWRCHLMEHPPPLTFHRPSLEQTTTEADQLENKVPFLF